MPILSWDQCLFSLHKHHQVKVACLSLLLVDWHHWICLTYMVDAMSVAVLLQYYTSCMLHLEMTWVPRKILCDFEYFCDTVAWTASLISPHLALSQPCSSSAWRFPPNKSIDNMEGVLYGVHQRQGQCHHHQLLHQPGFMDDLTPWIVAV